MKSLVLSFAIVLLAASAALPAATNNGALKGTYVFSGSGSGWFIDEPDGKLDFANSGSINFSGNSNLSEGFGGLTASVTYIYQETFEDHEQELCQYSCGGEYFLSNSGIGDLYWECSLQNNNDYCDPNLEEDYGLYAPLGGGRACMTVFFTDAYSKAFSFCAENQ